MKYIKLSDKEIVNIIRNDMQLTYCDENLENTMLRKVKNAKSDLIISGVCEKIIDYDICLEAIETYVIDNLNVESGKRLISPLYNAQLLKLKGIEDVSNTN